MQTNIMSPNRRIIQGGMGVYISSPFLAKMVSVLGGQGTVSLVAPHIIMANKLQSGDVGGHFRRALAHFPFPEFSDMVLKEFFIEEGNPEGLSKRAVPVFTVNPSKLLISLSVCANFAFIWLAKEGHNNPVGANYLHDIQMPHVYALTGAIMAGVDYITMGAGIPLGIPELMRNVVSGAEVVHKIPVIGSTITSHSMRFDPKSFFGDKLPEMNIPGFVPIIASNLLASIFMKKLPKGSVQGFVIEEPTAGGHNAPPRTRILDDNGQPHLVYGKKDAVDYKEIADFGLPFWIGGSYASPEKLRWAISVGAVGIQAGSIFALCEESGMRPDIRAKLRELGFEGNLKVKTDMRISPTGFPFKVPAIPGTISEKEIYESRQRICNRGELVSLYEKANGSIGYRCPSEPVENFIRKGGKLEDTIGRGCICNGLITTAGLYNPDEAPVVTMGDDVCFLKHVMKSPNDSYTAEQALAYLQS